ncbi:MAG: HD domain-containing protein [Solirubrobacterales bacterium]
MADPLHAAREALRGRPAWLVGGAIRDRELGHRTVDLDVVVDGDPGEGARAIARAAGSAACFALSAEFGAWRVSARDSSWQIDVESLRGGSLHADLALRDFTVNAIAEPIAGGAPIDPLGGLVDLAAGRLRMAGPGAFAEDPLRVLRLVRVAIELGLEPEPDTLHAARAHAAELVRCSPERVFVELRRIVAAREVLRGLELMSELGATAVVFPELEALRGIEQNRFHHADVHGHTLEVLRCTIELDDFAAGRLDAARGESGGAAELDHGHGVELGAVLGEHRGAVAALLAEPLADGLTRGEALRWGALLHDAAKPLTRGVRAGDGRVTFIGHDERGAALAREVLGRLRTSERLRAHAVALVRHHLRLGFLVHEPQPLSRRTVFSYLRATDPVEVDVTLLSIADRLATRGERAKEAIAAHLRVAEGMLGDALRWRADGPPRPLLRGDELAQELEISPGPRLGALLEALAEAQFAGELATREQALAHARTLV